VDIEALLRTRADVEAVDWPIESVEAVMLRRVGERPQVFFRPRPDNRGRERFTLAHELGHILLPWHIGNAACLPGSGDSDLRSESDEDQADTFASCVLAPDFWLRELAEKHRGDMTGFLGEAVTAELSTTATLLALRRVMLAGWVFQLNNQPTPFSSPGTAYIGPMASGEALRDHLSDLAYEHGRTTVAGNAVRWWRLADMSPMPEPDDDPRTDTELLRASIAIHTRDPQAAQHRLQSANGKVGGGAMDAGGRNASDIFTALWHRFETDGRFEDLMLQPEFSMWLARKSRAKEAAGS
jgi:hypothetical protein